MKHVVPLIVLFSSTALADWQTLQFDVTKNDPNAYVSEIPADAFTPGGLRLAVKPGVQYSLMSKKVFSDEFDFELQIEVAERSEKGTIWVDLILLNEKQQRKVVGSYKNVSLKPGTDSGEIRYFKDGKAAGFQWGNHWQDSSTTTGYGNGTMEWLRLQLAGKKVWFMARLKDEPYRWPAVANYPPTTYFNEDCDSFSVGFVVRGSPEATGTLLIKALRISGATVLPRDTTKRTFLFDFGPPNQECEDDFCPVSEYSNYSPAKGYGWTIPEPEKIWYGTDHIPRLDDAAIAAAGLPPVPKDTEGWHQEFLRCAYWLQVHDKKLFYSTSHGHDFVEFFQKYLDLKTPLERDFVGMARPYHFGADPLYQKDVEERRGSIYIDDDLSAEFAVDLPNGRYNLILGVGYSDTLFSGGEMSASFNVEVEGRVRQQGLRPHWRRCHQFPIRNVAVTDGQMNLRFFTNVRQAMDKWANHDVGTGWMINYLAILPAEERELANEWEWRIIRRRGEIIRRVTFVQGDPAATRNEGNFLSLNGKPFYFLKVMNNYVPGDTDHFGYYCLANCLSASHSVRGSQHFFKPDWEKLSYSDDYPWDSVDRMNVAYTWRYLTTLHQDGILSFVPHAVSGEGSPTVDSRGRSNRYNVQPPLNSALGREIQREAYTMMCNQLRLHPAVAGHFIYEELWHPEDLGYDEQSLIQYWDWLRRRYPAIEALNQDWGRTYKAFEDIVQPEPHKREWWEYTPEFVHFRRFRTWAQLEMVRTACELIRLLDPFHFTWGAKGDFGTLSWYTGAFVDMFGWYTPYVAASAARYFGKAAICGGYMLNCEFAYLDGRRQFDHKAGPHHYMGRDEVGRIYTDLISGVFKGAKGFYNEWYSDGMCHVFHRTAYIKDAGPRYAVKHWTGQIAFYEPEAYEGPPVNIDRAPLYASRANQLLYRLAPLWLPAKPPEPKVLFPTTEASFFLNFFGERPYADFESVAMRILRSTNIPADFVALSAVKDLSRYQFIILGDTAQSVSQADARRIRDFVRNGGKLILMNAGGFSDDARPRRFRPSLPKVSNLREGMEVFPLEEFAELGGYRFVAEGPYHRTYGKAPVEFADGTKLGEYEALFYYDPAPGSEVFLKGTLTLPRVPNPREGTSKEVALGLLNKERNVAVISFPPYSRIGAKDELVRPLARFFRKLLAEWKIDGRVTLGGTDDAWDLYAGCLLGEGYTLAAVCNLSRDEDSKVDAGASDGSSPRGSVGTSGKKVALKLNVLPPGEYAVMDVTGERPDLAKKPDGGRTLQPNPAARQIRVNHTLSSQQLADQGIPCEVKPGQAQVFLIRPMDAKVWVSIWPPSLKGFVKRPVTIAHGTGPGEKAGADAIAAALGKAGVGGLAPFSSAKRVPVPLFPAKGGQAPPPKAEGEPVPVVSAGEVKLKKVRHEVRIKPTSSHRGYREDTASWYLVDAFDNEIVDSDSGFILVGSEATNPLIKHLGKEGAFAYDKVLERITPDYPGPGRGIIGTVECINSATYDLRSQSRDAILVGGSDAAGTGAAIAEFLALLRRHL